jgi:hypothetical protein
MPKSEVSYRNRLFWIGLTTLFITACSTPPKPNVPRFAQEQPGNVGALLLFAIKEPGTEAYQNRVFVNRDVMVMMDSRSAKDFLLFDRKSKTIYSTNSSDKTIFVIKPKAITAKPPIAIDYVETSQPSGAIPKVQGLQATHYRYDVNGKHCFDAVVMPDTFLPVVTSAMKDFREVLAGEHASTLGNIPKDMQDACDLAVNVFYATKHYEHGLPLREWDQNGYQKFLTDYKTGIEMDPKTYQLPKDYRQYSISDM